MKKTHFLLSITLTIILTLILIACNQTNPQKDNSISSIASTIENKEFSFQLLPDGTYSVIIVDSFSSIVTLPAAHQGKAVTQFLGIDEYFVGELTDIIIPDEITTINVNYSPFYDDLNIHISDIVTWSKKDVTLPVGTNLYLNDQRIAGQLILPEGVTELTKGPFSFLDDIISITLPTTLKSIESGALYNCLEGKGYTRDCRIKEIINHSSLNIKAGYKNNGGIAEYATYVHQDKESRYEYFNDFVIDGHTVVRYIGMSSDVVFSKHSVGMYNIGEDAFEGRDDITSLSFEEGSVLVIEEHAFAGCSNISSVKLSSDIIQLGNWAFVGCDGLTSITIPKGVIYIGYGTFRYCDNLSEIHFNYPYDWIGIHASYGWKEQVHPDDEVGSAEELTSKYNSYIWYRQ